MGNPIYQTDMAAEWSPPVFDRVLRILTWNKHAVIPISPRPVMHVGYSFQWRSYRFHHWMEAGISPHLYVFHSLRLQFAPRPSLYMGGLAGCEGRSYESV